jgi:hypothetical protein
MSLTWRCVKVFGCLEIRLIVWLINLLPRVRFSYYYWNGTLVLEFVHRHEPFCIFCPARCPMVTLTSKVKAAFRAVSEEVCSDCGVLIR